MSQLMAAADTSAELLTRLHLSAVLPAFPELMKHSRPARELVRQHRFCLRFRAGKLGADLCFSQGRCRYLQRFPGRPTIQLQYFTYPQFNRAFGGGGWALPVPWLSPTSLPKLIAFMKLSARLKEAMATPGDPDTPERSLHVRLSLQVAAAAAAVLIEHEAFSKELLRGHEHGALRIRIEGTDCHLMIGWLNGRCAWGRNLPVPAQAELVFSNVDCAYESLQGTLDTMAAINGGQLRIRGYLPLAERLSLVLERVPLYLQA